MKITLNYFIDGAFMNGFVLFLSCILFTSFFKEIVRHFGHLCFVVYVSIIAFDSVIYRWGIEFFIRENCIRFDYKKEENHTIRLNQCCFWISFIQDPPCCVIGHEPYAMTVMFHTCKP